MAFNLQGAQTVELTVFGGLVTAKDAITLPEGVSPACNNVCFDRGSSVSSRPALQKVFATPDSINTFTYGKTFITPLGGVENLYLDSAGNLLWEDVINSPGTYTTIGTTTPHTYAKSITAFGREYIAISDGVYGQEVPLQWTGPNGWLDRVTQDGPGAPPTVSMFSLPTVSIGGTGTLSFTVVEIDPEGLSGSLWTSINVYMTGSVVGLVVGSALTIPTTSPNNYAGTYTVTGLYHGGGNTLAVCSCSLPSSMAYWAGSATATAPNGALIRSGNIVTANTSTAHGLKVGNQIIIAGVSPSTVGGATPSFSDSGSVVSIVINNEDQPGIATVTTFSVAPHGLSPGCQVAITGVGPTHVGETVPGTPPAIRSASWAGGIATIGTVADHHLSPGAVITIGGMAGAGATPYNGVWVVSQVTGTRTFSFAMPVVSVPSGTQTFTGSDIALAWPIPDTPNPTYFEVISCPTPYSFTVQVTYVDGTWTTGLVTQAWNGTYYVQSVPTTTSFTYQQIGPDNPAASPTWGTGGSATPFGQLAPGVHQCQVHFLTRNDYVTRPSPPIQFTSPGGKFIQVSNIPIGPPNTIARILAFTGASGAFFFYLGTNPQANGQIVGTASQINDNTTTSAVLDFADNTLYAATGVSTEGNDLGNQVILDSCLGFGFFDSRLIAYGQRNRVQGFLNMGFEGGYIAGSLANQPSGWIGTSGSLTTAHYGVAWAAGGSLTQSAYQTAGGVPILTPNTPYRLRCWSTAASVTVTISSAAGGWTLTAIGAGTTSGSWVDVAFTGTLPTVINSDALLTVTATAGQLVDDISIVYAQNPYLLDVAWASYADNPEAFDGVSGVFGPNNDTHQMFEVVGMGGALYMLTQDPGGRIHKLIDNGQEPAYWPVQQIGANCGVLSAFGTAKSQADDSTGSGGEEWIAWASATGARIFDGSVPWKISAEIEASGVGLTSAVTGWQNNIAAANLTVWAVNDPVGRQLYFGLPQGRVASCSAPDRVYICNYRELDTAYQIAQSAPIHTSYTGRLIATDHTRKWAPWDVAANGASLMYRTANTRQIVMLGGNGRLPGAAVGYGNVYTLNPAKYTDDDFGQIYPAYTTCFFLSHDLAQAMKLQGRLMLAYLTAFVSGHGSVIFAPLVNNLLTAWAQAGQRVLSANPANDLEWTGGNASGYRIAITIYSLPSYGQADSAGTKLTWKSGALFSGQVPGNTIYYNAFPFTVVSVDSPTSMTITPTAYNQTNQTWVQANTDTYFNLERLSLAFKVATHIPVRGSV